MDEAVVSSPRAMRPCPGRGLFSIRAPFSCSGSQARSRMLAETGLSQTPPRSRNRPSQAGTSLLR
eukprot:15460546-Alexandrium_andersonii.AAC.1